MISCKDFIPVYSEIFCYLESHFGRQEVDNYWDAIFKVNAAKKSPLLVCLEKEGLKGCFTYWNGTLNEEAAHFSMYLNEKRGFFIIDMHRCPSKGRLLELEQSIGVKPYRDYCLHCDYYRVAVEQVGLKYIYNFNGIHKAACSLLIYDPKVFDGRVIIDENTEIQDVRASDNEYFHRDFHSGMNNGCEYVGSRFGEEELVAYLTRYTKNVYKPVFAAIKEKGLKAIEEKILDTYALEKYPEAVKTTLDDTGLLVEVAFCPAVKHLRATGRDMSKWYPYSTTVVMESLAKAAGVTFVMDAYDHETGAARYRFVK